jgi:hypothetical protein
LLVRRLISYLTLWICLLGLIQPTLGCTARTDCYPTRSPALRIEQITTPSITADDCCSARCALASSPWVVAQPRKAPDQATSPPALHGAPADVSVPRRVIHAGPPVLADYHGNESLTYLRTARLRL